VRRAPCGARCAYRRSTAVLMAANQRRHSAPDALPGTRLRRPLLRLHLSQSSDPIAGRS